MKPGGGRARDPFTPMESERTECKTSLAEWREVVETVAAFATSGGGQVRIGIAPDGTRIGVRLGRGTLEDLANKIKVNTDPAQFASIGVEGPDDSTVVTIRVEESPIKPVWAFGRPLKRVGRTNQHVSRAEAQRMAETTTGRTWDAMACSGFQDKDIDKKAVRDYLGRAGLVARAAPTLLKNLALLTPDGMTCNGAVLLFARHPQQFFPEAQLKCARFAGTTSVRFLDEQTLDGNVLSQLDRALAFVTRNTRQEIRITGRPERESVPEYAEEAVREAIVNALCHRDYAAVGTIQVRIYDDRLEVWNPGILQGSHNMLSASDCAISARLVHDRGEIECWDNAGFGRRRCETVQPRWRDYGAIMARFGAGLMRGYCGISAGFGRKRQWASRSRWHDHGAFVARSSAGLVAGFGWADDGSTGVRTGRPCGRGRILDGQERPAEAAGPTPSTRGGRDVKSMPRSVLRVNLDLPRMIKARRWERIGGWLLGR